MALELPDARQLADDVIHAVRIYALRALEMGYSEADVADLFGLSRETVCRWWVAYSAGGLGAVPGDRTGRPVGSGRTLTQDQERQLQDRIDGHSPEDHGIASPLWTRRAVRDLIHQECGVAMPIRTVGEYLRRWGYTVKKPSRRARQQDPEEVRKWLEKEYPALERRAAKEGAEIHWCDETGVAADQHLGFGYAREGERATVEVPDRHVRMNMVSTVSASGQLHFMTYATTLTAAVFVVFLERLLRTTTGKIILVADRLPVHTSGAVSEWLARHRDRIELVVMPRYAPELNPVEYLNNDVKGNVSREKLPGTRAELRSQVRGFMRRLQQAGERVASIFGHPEVQYAAANA
jgi:transposase